MLYFKILQRTVHVPIATAALIRFISTMAWWVYASSCSSGLNFTSSIRMRKNLPISSVAGLSDSRLCRILYQLRLDRVSGRAFCRLPSKYICFCSCGVSLNCVSPSMAFSALEKSFRNPVRSRTRLFLPQLRTLKYSRTSLFPIALVWTDTAAGVV